MRNFQNISTYKKVSLVKDNRNIAKTVLDHPG